MFRSLSLSSLLVVFRLCLCGILTKHLLFCAGPREFSFSCFSVSKMHLFSNTVLFNKCTKAVTKHFSLPFWLLFSLFILWLKHFVFQSCVYRDWHVCVSVCVFCRKSGSAPLMQLTRASWAPSLRSKSATACTTFAMASLPLTPPSSPSPRMESSRTAAAD